MNEKKAKKIRRAVGFAPGAPREYKTEGRRVGQQLLPGTVTTVGARPEYQIAKRVAQKMRLA